MRESWERQDVFDLIHDDLQMEKEKKEMKQKGKEKAKKAWN